MGVETRRDRERGKRGVAGVWGAWEGVRVCVVVDAGEGEG